MDILGLGDEMKFKAPEKIWVFFSVAAPLTAATFLIWFIWDRRMARQDRAVAGNGCEAPEDLRHGDGRVVEPAVQGPEPSYEALLQEVNAIIGRKNVYDNNESLIDDSDPTAIANNNLAGAIEV